MEELMFVAAPTALLLAGRQNVLRNVSTRKFSTVTAVSWTSQEFWLTHERLELLGDSHLEVETRSRDLNTAVTGRIRKAVTLKQY